MKFLILFAVLISISVTSNGQRINCTTQDNVTNPISESALESTGGNAVIRLYIFRVGEANCVNQPTLADAYTAISNLESCFSEHGIFFTVACIDEICQNYYHPDDYIRDDGINIFLHNGSGGHASIAGNRVSSGPDYVTICHEVGHALGLNHTHKGSPHLVSPPLADQGLAEYVDGSNCATAGDFICDTPADPEPDFTNTQGCTFEGLKSIRDGNPNGSHPDGDWYENVDVNNLMSYYDDVCLSHFTQGQGNYMKNAINTVPALQNTKNDDAIIFSPTTWLSDKEFNTDVIIKPGGILTIYSTVKMAPGKKIIVEFGGELHVDGGKLTNGAATECFGGSTGLWKGVELTNPDWPVGPPDFLPNSVSMTNGAVLENSESGIHFFSSSQFFSGEVNISDSRFINNKSCLSFKSSNNQNLWFFGNATNTDFIIDENYTEDNMDGMVYLDMQGIPFNFSNCRFEKDDASRFSGSYADFAISSLNSNFNITGDDFSTSYFKNLTTGIRARSHSKFNLSKTEFTKVADGIEIITNTDFSVNGCRFNLGAHPELAERGIICQRGVNNMNIEKNEFISTNSSGSVKGFESFNNGSGNAYIAENIFNGFRFAIKTELNNSGANFRCNTFTNVIGDDFSFNGVVSNPQGSQAFPAGNKFSYGSGKDINSSNILTYWYNSITSNEEPLVISGVDKRATQDLSNCSISKPNNGVEIEDYYDFHFSTLSSYQNNYKNLIDGGNTTSLLQSIQNTNPSDLDLHYSDLISISPYLSEVILREVYTRTDLYTDLERFNLLAGNPDVLKNNEFWNDLFGSEISLPVESLNQLEPYRYYTTERTELEGNINFHRAEAGWAVTSGISLMLLDPDNTPVNYRNWLIKHNDFDALIQAAYTYYQEGDFSGLDNFLLDIPGFIEISQVEQFDLQNFSTFMNVLKQEIESGGNEYTLDFNEQAILLNIASGNSGVSNLIKGFLEVRYGYEFGSENETFGSYTKIKSGKKFDTLKFEGANAGINVFPNPSDRTFNFDLSSTSLQVYYIVKILNFDGRLIEEIQVLPGERTIIWDAENNKKGIYFYVISNSQGLVSSGKLSLVK